MNAILFTLALVVLSFSVYATTYNYDNSGRVIGIVYPDGKEIGYSYDESGNISAVHQTAQSASSSTTTPSDPNPATTTTTTTTADSGGSSSEGGGGAGAFGINGVLLLLLSLVPFVIRRFRRHSV